MKKVLAFAAIAAILAGCAKEIDNQIAESTNNEEVSKVAKVVLHASIPEVDTKVSTDNAGAYKWQAGDVVTVLNTSGTPYEFDTEEGGTAVDFSSTTFDGTLSTEAFYPASDNHVSGKFYLEPSFDWSSDSSLMPMLGTVDTGELSASFQSAGAVIKLICYNVDKDADKLVVTSDSKQIVGQFTPSGSPKVITASASDENKVLTINFATAVAARNMVFYIPLPTGNVGKLTFTIKAGDTVKFSKETKAAVPLSRNTVIIPSPLNCGPAPDDDVLTNSDITSSGLTNSYSEVAITSATGKTWNVKACKQDTNKLQLKSGGANAYIQLPDYSEDNIASIVLEGVYNASGSAYSGTITLSTAATDGTTITSVSPSVAAGGTVTIKVPSGYSTGYILTNAGLRITSITVTFQAPFNAPTITTGTQSLTIGIGNKSASTSATLSNPIDELGVSYIISKKDDKPIDWIESVSIDAGTLTATAVNKINSNAVDNEAIITLKASGAESKTINLKQTSAVVANPASIHVENGNHTFSASWSKATHATAYVAYLCESSGLSDPTGGTSLTPVLDGSTYTVTSDDVDNGDTYYLYVKVSGVDENYAVPSSYLEATVQPVAEPSYISLPAIPTNTTYSYTSLNSLTSGGYTWYFKGYKNANADQYIQLKKDNDVYIEIPPVPGTITSIECSIGSGSAYNLAFCATSNGAAVVSSSNATLPSSITLTPTADTYRNGFIKCPDNSGYIQITGVTVNYAPDDATVSSLAITNPTKLTYVVNEAVSFAGGTATATYSDATTAVVTSHVSLTYDTSSAGNKTVTVSFGGQSDTYQITVTSKTTVYTLTPASSNAQGSSTYSTAIDFNITGNNQTITWNVEANTSNTPWLVGGGKGTNVTRTIYSKTNMSGDCDEIAIATNGISNSNLTINNVTVTAYPSADDMSANTNGVSFTSSDNLSFSVSTDKTLTFTKSGNTNCNGYRYKVVVTYTHNKSSNYNLRLTGITFYRN